MRALREWWELVTGRKVLDQIEALRVQSVALQEKLDALGKDLSKTQVELEATTARVKRGVTSR
jgi:hypothetical protein